jgi:hypothetical protein
MPHFCFQSLTKGFMILMPLVFISVSTFSAVYLMMYKVDHFAHALQRHEAFLQEYYEKKGCSNLANLYSSYDPSYLINC